MQQSTPVVNLANPKTQKSGGAKRTKWAFQTSGKGKVFAGKTKAFDALISERAKVAKTGLKGTKTLPTIQKKVQDATNVQSAVVKFQKGAGGLKSAKLPNKKASTNVADKEPATLKKSDKSAKAGEELLAALSEKDESAQVLQEAMLTTATQPTFLEAATQNIGSDDAFVDTFDGPNTLEGAKAKVSYLDKDKKVRVTDYRVATDSSNKAQTLDGEPKLKVLEVKTDENGKTSLTLDLNTAAQNATNQNILASSDQSASATGSNFQAMLANAVTQSAPEFVKAGNIILRDKDEGQIKLVLHPENLGDVKIDLQLHDKAISAKIVVATSEAFGAFKESSDALKEAFIQSGFESANFDLSFANGGSQNGSNKDGGTERAMFARANNAFGAVGDLADDSTETSLGTRGVYSVEGRRAVNMIA